MLVNRDLSIVEHEMNRLVVSMRDSKEKLDERSMNDLLNN